MGDGGLSKVNSAWAGGRVRKLKAHRKAEADAGSGEAGRGQASRQGWARAWANCRRHRRSLGRRSVVQHSLAGGRLRWDYCAQGDSVCNAAALVAIALRQSVTE